MSEVVTEVDHHWVPAELVIVGDRAFWVADGKYIIGLTEDALIKAYNRLRAAKGR